MRYSFHMNLPLVLLWFAEPWSIIKTSFHYLHLTRASVVTTPDSLQCKTININTLWYWVGIFAALKWSTYCWVALGGIVIIFKSLCHSVPPVWFLHNNLRDLLFVGGEFYFYLERTQFFKFSLIDSFSDLMFILFSWLSVLVTPVRYSQRVLNIYKKMY